MESYGATQENTKVTLRYGTGVALTLTLAKFGELWGNPRKYKSHTLPGRKFALLEGLIHDLKSVPDRFIMSILRGRCGTVNYHPVLKLIN